MNTILGNEILREYEGRISAKAAAVFMNLVVHSNKKNTCFPSLNTIHKETSFSKRSVQRGLDELLKLGLITKKHNFREDGSQTSNIYSIISAASERISAIEENIQQKKKDMEKKLQQIRDNKKQCRMRLKEQVASAELPEEEVKEGMGFLSAVRDMLKFSYLSMGYRQNGHPRT